MKDAKLYLRRCREIRMLQRERKWARQVDAIVEEFLASLAEVRQPGVIVSVLPKRRISLRVVKKLMKYYTKGGELANLNANHFNLKNGGKYMELIKMVKPREIVELDFSSPCLSYSHLNDKYLFKGIRLTPFVINRLKIEKCYIRNYHLRKIFVFSRNTRMIMFKKCQIDTTEIKPLDSFKFQTLFLYFKECSGWFSENWGNDPKLVEALIKTISTCGLKNSLNRIYLSKTSLTETQVIEWLETYSLYDVIISMLDFTSDDSRDCVLKSEHSIPLKEKILTKSEDKCLIQ
ncbi:unnamed protein product [Moneuplotes crassus]|uniref:Uncharacterized protein n=1 Tax=Euplotes crassus TaxID=5936 RepID=A0AAD1XRJ0_EUPCR|nr:unnamed protein product [Moneuplotes crassus]